MPCLMYLEIIQYKYHDISTHLLAKYHIYDSCFHSKHERKIVLFTQILCIITTGNKNMF